MGTLIVTILLLGFWVFISFTIIKAFLSFAPWVPIFKKDVDRIIRLANLQSDETFVDLGCGNGRMCLAMALKTSGRVQGIELAWPLYAICKIRQFLYNKKNLEFIFGNLFKADLSKYDVIYLYGLPNQIKKNFSQKILKDGKPGTRVISYCFEIPGLDSKIIDQPSQKDLPIYYYTL